MSCPDTGIYRCSPCNSGIPRFEDPSLTPMAHFEDFLPAILESFVDLSQERARDGLCSFPSKLDLFNRVLDDHPGLDEDQVNEAIDHAVATKLLALFCTGQPLQDPDGLDALLRINYDPSEPADWTPKAYHAYVAYLYGISRSRGAPPLSISDAYEWANQVIKDTGIVYSNGSVTGSRRDLNLCQ